jgi:hypothetical protein
MYVLHKRICRMHKTMFFFFEVYTFSFPCQASHQHIHKDSMYVDSMYVCMYVRMYVMHKCICCIHNFSPYPLISLVTPPISASTQIACMPPISASTQIACMPPISASTQIACMPVCIAQMHMPHAQNNFWGPLTIFDDVHIFSFPLSRSHQHIHKDSMCVCMCMHVCMYVMHKCICRMHSTSFQYLPSHFPCYASHQHIHKYRKKVLLKRAFKHLPSLRKQNLSIRPFSNVCSNFLHLDDNVFMLRTSLCNMSKIVVKIILLKQQQLLRSTKMKFVSNVHSNTCHHCETTIYQTTQFHTVQK